jgi:hypothetical protein
LSCGVLEDTRTPRWEIMMTMLPGDICLLQQLTAHRAPWGTWWFRRCPRQEAGAGATGHAAPPELPQARRRELEPRVMWRSRSWPKPRGGSWSHRTRGSPGFALSQETGAGATGHVAAPELARARTRELAPQEVWRPLSCPCQVASPDVMNTWMRIERTPCP